MENLFDLLATPPGVADRPGARALVVTAGAVAFENVDFWYLPSAPVLRGLTFAAPGGSTLALVGATGGGKSTVRGRVHACVCMGGREAGGARGATQRAPRPH